MKFSFPCLDPPECSEGWQNTSQVAISGQISGLSCRVDAWPLSHIQMDWSLLLPNGKEIPIRNGQIVREPQESADSPSSGTDYGRQSSLKSRDENSRWNPISATNLNVSSGGEASATLKRKPSPSSSVLREQKLTYSSYLGKINVTINYASGSLTVLCRARNVIGIQKTPCRIHLSPTEFLPVSQLTSVSSDSKESFLNCTSREIPSGQGRLIADISVSCPMAEKMELRYRRFVLQSWKNDSLVWNVARWVPGSMPAHCNLNT